MILAGPPDAAAFARFGGFVEGPVLTGARQHYSEWLPPVAGLNLQFHINHVRATALPLRLTQIECHPHAAQVFLPLDVSRYVVTVMPGDSDDTPDPSRVLSMVLPGTVGVIYRAGAWHAGVTVLDRDAQFAVLMYRGAPDDDVVRTIAPVMVAQATGAVHV